jgi:hypothetical protein
MFKQEMHSQDLDGVVDKAHTLIVNQGECVVGLHQVKGPCCDRYNVGPQLFGLH